MADIDLSGRVAIVTGSSRGIGAAIADKFAASGASVILNGLQDGDLLQGHAADLASKYGVNVKAVAGDIADADVPHALVKEAFSSFRRLDIMVNNAGVLRDSVIGMIQEDQIDETLNVNLRGVLNGIQAAARLMQRNKSGSIINISSIIGRVGNSGQLVYGASKAGVIGATMSAAKELAPFGIRVNSIAPGYIETDMIGQIPADVHKERLESIAMQKIGKPEHVADAALFFASDLSQYVTGQVLGVDGGMLI